MRKRHPFIYIYGIIPMMKKTLKIFFILICVFVMGCHRNNNDSSTKAKAYQNYYTAITENTKFSGSSNYYQIHGEMSELPDGSHRYYVIFDEPTTAMFNCVVMAVEDDIPYDDNTKMMPSIGIFDKLSYSMIPNQINAQEGFVKGLTISGETPNTEVHLKVIVEWKDASGNRVTREFFSFKLSNAGLEYEQVSSGE